jgi:hypothetical protein
MKGRSKEPGNGLPYQAASKHQQWRYLHAINSKGWNWFSERTFA